MKRAFKQRMPNRDLYLGIESGGSKVAALVVDSDFRERGRSELRRNSDHTAQDTMQTVLAAAEEALTQAGATDKKSLLAAGWGFGGGVDRETNNPTENLREPGWENIQAGRQLEAFLGCPVYIENDCNVAAIGEAHLGAGTNRGISIYMTVGSGVGAGITVDGKLFRASRFGEAEVGHLVVGSEGPPCVCGNIGCLEVYSSGDGMAKMARWAAPAFKDRSPLAREILTESIQKPLTPLLFQAYQDDPLSKKIIDEATDKLGLACSMLINLFVPKCIVFGGGVIQQAMVLPAIEQAIAGRVVSQLKADFCLKTTALGDMAVPLGAALHAGIESGGAVPNAFEQ